MDKKLYDAAIRAQAVKEFAEKLISTMPWAGGFEAHEMNGAGRQLDACIAHIKSMGGIE